MENMIDGLMVEVLFPFAVLGGFFVVTAVVVETVERIKAKREGRAPKSIF